MDIKGIRNIEFLARGKRSKVYTGILNGKNVAIKVTDRAKKEAFWLKILNKKNVGPKLIKSTNGYLVYELVVGERILDYIETHNKKQILNVLKEVFKQCRTMDKLKINKLEMHNPWKHVIIGKKAKMIDFERCYNTENPKNVTQFGQFLLRKKENLRSKCVKINRKNFINLLKQYKTNKTNKTFNQVINSLL